MIGIAGCTPAACIDAATSVLLLTIALGCFGCGYAVGNAVLWIKRMQDVV